MYYRTLYYTASTPYVAFEAALLLLAAAAGLRAEDYTPEIAKVKFPLENAAKHT